MFAVNLTKREINVIMVDYMPITETIIKWMNDLDKAFYVGTFIVVWLAIINAFILSKRSYSYRSMMFLQMATLLKYSGVNFPTNF